MYLDDYGTDERTNDNTLLSVNLKRYARKQIVLTCEPTRKCMRYTHNMSSTLLSRGEQCVTCEEASISVINITRSSNGNVTAKLFCDT